jgi:3-oxoacyl-(acyl-carrier-protein) synthase
LAGGVEELSEELQLAFAESELLSSDAGANTTAVGPGLILSEGAALLVLEEESFALARGARLLGQVDGVGSAFDVSIMRDKQSAVDSISRSMQLALSDGDVGPADIDCIVTSRNGLHLTDHCEQQAIWQQFGSSIRAEVLAPKHWFGESLGGGGPMQAIAALRRMLAPDGPPCRRVLINSISYDGHCCSLLLGRAAANDAHANN